MDKDIRLHVLTGKLSSFRVSIFIYSGVGKEVAKSRVIVLYYIQDSCKEDERRLLSNSSSEQHIILIFYVSAIENQR